MNTLLMRKCRILGPALSSVRVPRMNEVLAEYDPKTKEVEGGGGSEIEDHPQLHSKPETSPDYIDLVSKEEMDGVWGNSK